MACEIEQLAYEIADEAAWLDIDCACLPHTFSGAEYVHLYEGSPSEFAAIVAARAGTWWEIQHVDELGRDEVARAVRYLDARGKLMHHPDRHANGVTGEYLSCRR